VLVTIEYTALHSFDYGQQVMQTLRPTTSGDRPFSFRNDFSDQWYDLHNPEQTATPMVVRFRTLREDFPPNLDTLKIQHVVLYFVRADRATFEMPVARFRLFDDDGGSVTGGAASSSDGIVSTRRGNAGSWMPLIGKSPVGEWELTLPNSEEVRARF